MARTSLNYRMASHPLFRIPAPSTVISRLSDASSTLEPYWKDVIISAAARAHGVERLAEFRFQFSWMRWVSATSSFLSFPVQPSNLLFLVQALFLVGDLAEIALAGFLPCTAGIHSPGRAFLVQPLYRLPPAAFPVLPAAGGNNRISGPGYRR